MEDTQTEIHNLKEQISRLEEQNRQQYGALMYRCAVMKDLLKALKFYADMEHIVYTDDPKDFKEKVFFDYVRDSEDYEQVGSDLQSISVEIGTVAKKAITEL